MPYQVKLVGPIEREASIKLAVTASQTGDEMLFFEFRNHRTKLKVIRIQVGLPIYRVENCRTYTEQEEYISRENQSADFFSTGQENETVQNLQHEILRGLANIGPGSVAVIIDVLRKEGQREPILITSTGVVVNGNRRLAAMRELHANDSEVFRHFSHVDCMVLPEDATPEEILDIEASLQAKAETKLDYDWIGECHLIKRLVNLGRKTSDIAVQLGRDDKEIKNSLKAFNEAQIYLKEWVKKERAFGLVKKDGYQFFKDLPKELEGKTTGLENASRTIAWTLFDNREHLGTRLYLFNAAFGKRAGDVMERTAAHLGIEVTANTKPSDATEEELPVEIDDTAPVDYTRVLEAILDPRRKEEVAATLIEVCRGVIESEDDRRQSITAEKHVIAAYSRLQRVDLSQASPSTYAAIDNRLESIAKITNDLREALKRYESHRVEPPPADE